MPEAPELAIVREVLERRLSGVSIETARVIRPTILRSSAAEDLAADIASRAFLNVLRYGKTLTLTLAGDRAMVVIPMLTGGLQLASPRDRIGKATSLILSLSHGEELRYFDDRQMGMVYYVNAAQQAEIPRLQEGGPDVLDEPLGLEEFKEGLRPFQGEIKGILTRGRLVAGIGNAYADEILFDAQISPFRRRREITPAEMERLHEAVYRVPREAVAALRGRMGEDIHLKPRDFLRVHNKGGSPCPRCGGRISQVSPHRRITSYCLRCQPGLLIRN